MEALYIHHNKPSLNMKFEGGQLLDANLYINMTEQERRDLVALQQQRRRERRQQNQQQQPDAQHDCYGVWAG